MTKPLITVLLPVYNGKKYIKIATESILKQSFKQFELIILDDNSTDSTIKIVRSIKDKRLRIILHSQKIGISELLNEGVRIARGEYIARMDADDIAHYDRLKQQINYLHSHPQVGIVSSGVTYIGSNGEVLSKKYIIPIVKSTIFYKNPLIHPTVMFRKALILRYGGYDVSLDGAEDYDLWLRYNKITQIAILPRPLLKYRLSPYAVSITNHRRVLWSYVKAKWKSVFSYHYPAWHLIFCMYGLASLSIPLPIKKFFFKQYTY